ncbi:NAD(P)/FAD-dependent oxidoreductase [Streptomyces sp. NL15-2K]|uniref:flavin-containing monooxygenase n=1 Tax=Streptomyces sp. NL15-2K TaxID=376149 RepID=UPI000F58E2DD|nr:MULTISPECIES: NAD(P)-binding domain-containing protein [Actinomycetes]WKX07420.1 NAD(P)-binding domain-containing protein [Kutzneria buriramensis]GCB51346.1 flavin-binding family monooxygenase [Streptomyces sp. NL15-2K]
MPRYCVIGAGAAGISALQQLRQLGHDVDCFERTDLVGGHWHTDYEALHLITSRDMTTFEDFPMPADYPHFPRRDQVRAYIESYAREHGLYEIIRFNTAVTSVEPVEAPEGVTDAQAGAYGWRVTTSAGDDEVYEGVLVANGHLWDPKFPDIPGEFAGKTIHSGVYRNVSDLEGDRILVVGAGNSGCDLAVDVAQHRLDVDIVIRQGSWFQPKTYFGVPRQQVSFLAEFSPPEQDLINRLMARLSIGDWNAYPGLPEPEGATLAEGRAVVNDLLLYWIHHGRITVRPGIDRFDGDTVHFSDGTAHDYDTILWATGFNVRLPFLDDALFSWAAGAPVRYAAGIVTEAVEKLYFIGLIAPRGPQFPVYGMQTKLVAKMIELHEQAGPGGAPVARYLASLQEPETGIDVVRDGWLRQLADTERLLAAYELSSGNAESSLQTV